MTAPHPLLGVPVVVLHPAGWETGTITIIISDETRAVVRVSDSVHRTVNLSDEGTTWRRAGVEYPAAVAEVAPDPKSLGEVAYRAMPSAVRLNQRVASQLEWEDAASAVIAAYEAGRKTEAVTRWAVRDIRDDNWWCGSQWSWEQCDRALFADRVDAERAMSRAGFDQVSKYVPVPFRRRVKVKP